MNLNDMVRVKLKPEGLRILQDSHNELAADIRKRGGKMEDWAGAKVDDEGYYRTQLWCLMQDFGPHIRLGGEPPFETEILPEKPAALPEGREPKLPVVRSVLCDKFCQYAQGVIREAIDDYDAARYRWIRKNAVWRASRGGSEQSVTWDLFMPEPDIRDGKLTDDSVAKELDAAIDHARAPQSQP